MDEQVRVFRSAVDGKFYKYEGANIDRTKRFYNAGIVTLADVEEIEAQVILDEVLGRARPFYNLRKICRIIPMDELVCTIDIASGLTVQRKVAPLEEATISKETYISVDFDLWKNVGHVVVSDEAGMKARHPIFNESINECGRDLARVENLDIKDSVETEITEKVSSATYSDWGAVTSGVSNTNPFTSIIAKINYIQSKGYQPDFMAMHNTLFGKFIQNTYVRDLVHAGMATLSANGGAFSLPGYPTIRIITDFALTETPTSTVGPVIGWSGAVVLGKGPTMAAKYRNEKAGYDAYIIRDWLQPKVVLDEALDIICT